MRKMFGCEIFESRLVTLARDTDLPHNHGRMNRGNGFPGHIFGSGHILGRRVTVRLSFTDA